MNILESFKGLWIETGVAGFLATGGWANLVMILVGLLLVWLGLKKGI